MTPAREALGLPALLLTVALLGGLRIGDRIAFVPPPLFALVLGVLLFGALIRSGALAPSRLAHASRSTLASVNGLIVLGALFLASGQVFHLVTPEGGLPRLAADVFFLVLLLNTWATSPDRERLLRSLMVIFGSAFVLKFIVLAALSDPDAGRFHRMLVVLFDGVTLGAVTQDAFHPATGYAAFLTLALFLLAVSLLPRVDDVDATALELRELPVKPRAELLERGLPPPSDRTD